MTAAEEARRSTGLATDRLRLVSEIVDSLRAVEAVQSPDSLQGLLRMLRQAFNDEVDIAYSPVLQHQLLEVAEKCLKRAGGLRALAECVELYEPGSPAKTALLLFADEWQVLQQLDGYDIAWLRQELSDRPVTPELRRFVKDGRSPVLPDHCTDIWRLFAHLTAINAAPDRTPRAPVWLRLLGRIELVVSDPGRLRDLVAALADEWGVIEQPGERTRPGRIGPGVATAHLVIQFEKYGGDDSSYLMSHWHQWASSEWEPIRGEDRCVSHDELEAAVDRLVIEAEQRWADQVGPVMIEFVLPYQLLGEPVDQWRKELDSGMPSPLTSEYPLVIRSLERIRSKHWHRVWRTRWERLRGWEQVQIHRDTPDGADGLETILKQEGRVVVLVLSESPMSRPHGRRRLMAGLRSGMPAIVWHREPARGGELFDTVISMLDSAGSEVGLAELPRLVAKLRQSAWVEAPSGTNHIGHGFVLLWDDPHRQPGESGSTGYDVGEVSA